MADDLFYLYDESAGKGFYITNRTNTNRLILCTFVCCEPKYLRDSSEAYLREYIQLRTLPKAASQQASAASTPDAFAPNIWAELEQNQPEWTLILNDSTIYTSLDDFRSSEAREAMQAYLDLQNQIAEENEDLVQHREAFREAQAEERNQLKPLIIALETDIRRLYQEAEKARKEVIRKETELAESAE